MIIKYQRRIVSGYAKVKIGDMSNTRKALLAFPLVVAIASTLSAGDCYLTQQVPCGAGSSYTNNCCSDGSCTNVFVYTQSAGPNINMVFGNYNSGFYSYTNEPVYPCIQSYSYTACPGVPAGSGSVTNNTQPQHGVSPGCQGS